MNRIDIVFKIWGDAHENVLIIRGNVSEKDISLKCFLRGYHAHAVDKIRLLFSHAYTDANNKDEVFPPNPKEFDSTLHNEIPRFNSFTGVISSSGI